jgi:hypothetical protein
MALSFSFVGSLSMIFSVVVVRAADVLVVEQRRRFTLDEVTGSAAGRAGSIRSFVPSAHGGERALACRFEPVRRKRPVKPLTLRHERRARVLERCPGARRHRVG